MNTASNPEEWLVIKRKAAALNHHINELIYHKGVELVLFRNPLNDITISELLNLHDYAEKIVGKPIEVDTSEKLAKALLNFDFKLSKIDIGHLNHQFTTSGIQDPNEFIKKELHSFFGSSESERKPQDVVLYGFGRIGRLAARAIIEMTGKGAQLRLRGIVTRSNDDAQLVKRADLLRMDSVHGPFKGVVDVDPENKCLIVNGEKVHMIAANDPQQIDYTRYGMNDVLIIDNTGVWRDEAGMSKHLKAKGVSNVLLTAPGKGVVNIVYGVNHQEFAPDDHQLWSAASCTTNAIVPVLKVVDDHVGIVQGHIETIHAYTNDQNLLDNYHKKHRRGRSAAINMVITETGAATAAAKVMPQLSGKLTASAVRVPTPNGSLAIMHLELNAPVTADQVNHMMKNAALEGPLRNQIKYSIEPELVSTDIIGNTCCSVYDSPAIKVSKDGTQVVLYVWYDNEYGYTQQVIRLAKYVTKKQRLIYD